MPVQFYSHGKLLITGEYAVLDGALCLALPTRYGQSLEVYDQKEDNLLKWKSLDYKKQTWFESTIRVGATSNELRLSASGNSPFNQNINNTLLAVLKAAIKLNPGFILELQGKQIVTKLEFPNDWGLGSSSTFINNVAQWAKVDSYSLLWQGFTGSGYDIACAKHNSPLLYSVKNGKPQITEVHFSPAFLDKLFFIHLNKKQNSREGIKRYRERKVEKDLLETHINSLTLEICNTDNLKTFELLLEKHEHIIGEVLGLTPVKQLLFSNFKGAVKSLGAWGGDFILATGDKAYVVDYFVTKGYSTVIPYPEMVL